ncbi:MAG TPA: hypothetical protein VKA74_11230 [Myxococcota bacterium]|nr:hypothetical protein [Myxococcota bacterium]
MNDPKPTPSALKDLAERRPPVVSLFVPVTASVPGRSQNAVQAERLVQQGLEKLRALEVDESRVREAEEALAEFTDSFGSPSPSVRTRAAYWSQDDGLSIYGLSSSVDEEASVAVAPVLRPVAKEARLASRYRVLVLSGKRIELYVGDAEGLEKVRDTKLPSSLDDALGADRTEERLQFHSTGGQGNMPLFHGQGGASQEREVDLERLHQRVARALEDEIESEPLPLVLASDPRHRPGLRDALQRDIGLLPEGIEGSPDPLSVGDLHRMGWPIVARHRPRPREELDRVRDREDGRLVSQVSDLVHYAVMGMIGHLWVPERGRIEGRLDLDTASVAPAQGDDDLIEHLIACVIRRGGEVGVLEGEALESERPSLFARVR